MTDNQSNAKSTQPQKPSTNDAKNSENNIAQRTSEQTVGSNDSKVADKTAENKKPEKAAEPQVKRINITIAGTTYGIFCPVNEEEELRSAVYYINNFALDIKNNAPNLNQENLLILTCLNLYEKIHANDKSDVERKQESSQSETLLNKIMQDAQSIL